MPAEGYWVNRSGKFKQIDEHAQWILNPKNAKSLGLDSDFIKKVKDLNYSTDREKILLTAMHEDLIRVRGHGSLIAFEFTMDTKNALKVIEIFLEKEYLAGPNSTLMFNNLRTHESVEVTYEEFQNAMMDDEWKAVLRVAKKRKMRFNYDRKRIGRIIKNLTEKSQE